MIVISSSLTLVEGDDELDPDLPLIGYHNIVDRTNIVADSELTNYPASNLANPSTFLAWSSNNVSETGSPGILESYITVTTNYVDEIDYLAIAGHSFGSVGNALQVEGSTDGITWFILIDEMLLGNDDPVLFRWEPQSLAAVRLRIMDATTATFASVMYVGKLLVMQRGLDIGQDFTPINYGRQPSIVNGASESGQFLGRIMIGEQRQNQAVFRWMEPDWYRTYFDPFAKSARTLPFFFAWSPDDYPLEVGYCWASQPIIPQMDPVTQRVHAAISMTGITDGFSFA